MNKKEALDIAGDMSEFFEYVQKADEKTPPGEVANKAIDCFKEILSNYPKMRHILYTYGHEKVLDSFGLDYGTK